ncbi:MAG: hypothetical protein QMD50_03510 [Patescibacteria group bacterium]|nr:hypothetical protein [Patescibacteria group bacterium]
MKIPYSELDLKIALLGMNDKNFLGKKARDLKKELDAVMPVNKAEMNLKVAEYNGIGLKELINSPNYAALLGDYRAHILNTAVGKIEKNLKITNKQAWAVIALVAGLIHLD